jgi:hypothetical protein
MATQYAFGKIVTDGLVLCLDAADRNSYVSGSTTWVDVAGSNNGTLINGPTFNATNGGAIVFDGTNDYINQTLNTGSFTTEASLCMFLKLPANQPGNAGGLMTLGNVSSSIGNSFPATHYPFTDGLGYFSTFRVNRVNSITLSSAVDKGTIHMLTITTTPGSNGWKLYQNNILVFQTTGESIITLSDLKIGRSENRVGTGGGFVADYYFQGNIYNVQIYNRVLSASEVLQNFNAQKSRFGL